MMRLLPYRRGTTALLLGATLGAEAGIAASGGAVLAMTRGLNGLIVALFIVAAALGAAIVVLLLWPYRFNADPSANAARHRFVFQGTYAGPREPVLAFARTRPAQRDPALAIAVVPLDVTGAAGTNLALARISVATLPGATCAIEVHYLGSDRPATARRLDVAIEADELGTAAWDWTPQQYREYVGDTRVTATVRAGDRWNVAVSHFTMQG